MSESISTSSAAVSMRRKAENRRGQGWVRNSFWLSPDSVEVLDRVRDHMMLPSREATFNAVLERIGEDVFLSQEFLAGTK